MGENSDIEYHRDILQKNISKLNEIHCIFQDISHNILGGYTYITSDMNFKLDNITKDKQYLMTQYNMLRIYLNSYIQLINGMIPELQKSQLISVSLLSTLTKQIEQIKNPSVKIDDNFDISQFDLSSLDNNIDFIPDTDITQTLFEDNTPISSVSHQNVISLHNKADETDTFTKIVDTTQEETNKTDTFTEEVIDDIVIEKNKSEEKNTEDKKQTKIFTELSSKKIDEIINNTTDDLKGSSTTLKKCSSTDDLPITSRNLSTSSSSNSSSNQSINKKNNTLKEKNILLEEHPDEIIKENYNIHDGPQLTDIIINKDVIIWNGGRANYFINYILNQLEINPMFSAHDIYHLLCANLLPNYVNILYLYDKYIQNYEIHLVDIKDQNIIKIGFKSIMLAYSANDKLFNSQKYDKIITEWNDSFHELRFYN